LCKIASKIFLAAEKHTSTFELEGDMGLSATFNNISVLLMEETVVPGGNHQPAASH